MVHHRKPIVAANWKMHNSPSETEEFMRAFLRLVPLGVQAKPNRIATQYTPLTHQVEPAFALAYQHVVRGDQRLRYRQGTTFRPQARAGGLRR